MTEAALLNHLWQSTGFALAAAAAAWALRRHAARLRFGIWFAASMKFLVPFGALAALAGDLLPRAPLESAVAAAAPAMAAARLPLAPIVTLAPSLAPETPPTHPLALALLALWLVGAVALAVRWMWRWRRLAALAPERVEPGVVGIFRPRIVLPPDLARRLSAAELAAVVAHERCHVRRRDNLWSALHMVVEVLFWFHPLVWCIGARMVAERERACDEAVLGAGAAASGAARAAYASAILAVCRHYLAPPAACHAGISGGSLTRRVRAILTGGPRRRLAGWQRAALALAAAAIITGPILLLAAQQAAPTHFDAATIKPVPPPSGGGPYRTIMVGTHLDPERLTAQNVTLKGLLETAYNLKPYQVVGPDWIDSQRFNVTAETASPATHDQMRALLQPFLTEQFHLKLRHTTKVMSAYVLVVAKGGLKVKPGDAAIERPAGAPPVRSMPEGMPAATAGGRRAMSGPMPPGAFMMQMSPAGLNLQGTSTMAQLTGTLSNFVDRPVLDATGLTAAYPIHLSFAPTGTMHMMGMRGPGMAVPDQPSGGAQASAPAPTLFMALKEQMGLTLESRQAPVELLIIEGGDKMPAGN